MNVTFRPIEKWPYERTKRPKPSRFRVGYSDTLELLDREIRMLKGKDVVIMLDLDESDIRLDGLPRSRANPAFQGVILSFESKYGPLKYYCDKFNDWQDNLRAIALGLESLRRVDRYGITKRGEQYTGWKALPGAGETDTTMTTKAAAQAIVTFAGSNGLDVDSVLQDREYMVRAYRRAAQNCHPDKPAGNHHKFTALQEARKILDRHHGG